MPHDEQHCTGPHCAACEGQGEQEMFAFYRKLMA